MIQLKFLSVVVLFVTLSFISCKKDEATVTENLTAEWNSTSVKIDGVASPATTTMFLHLQSNKQYEITTNITPFSQAKSGIWSNTADKLTLAGNAWTIHHIADKELRIEFVLDGKDLEIEFTK